MIPELRRQSVAEFRLIIFMVRIKILNTRDLHLIRAVCVYSVSSTNKEQVLQAGNRKFETNTR
jgi:hypothetical protein